MKKSLIALLIVSGLAFSWTEKSMVSVKCMIQLTNYGGEAAYLTVSLLDAEDNYVQTLYVSGFEEEWYPDLTSWYTFYDDDWESIDGITGASIQSGSRKITSLMIPSDKVGPGYKIRFETAVEDQRYYPKDVEISLDGGITNKTVEGSGYIRLVKMIAG